ncbi:MAG: type II toxin-antitoxin system RelE family toxin [Mycobacteriales bacterium]
MTVRYRLRITGPAAKALSNQLPEKIATAAYAFIVGPLLENPYRVGKPLGPPLEPVWSARRGSYRILCLVDESQRVVEVTAVKHRADAYRS